MESLRLIRINTTMIPRLSLSILVAIAVLLGAASATVHEGMQDSVNFSYSGMTGPGHWGDLSPAYTPCASGKHQSPVNIIKNRTILNQTLEHLAKNYTTAANATITNFGFVIGVRYEGYIGDLVIDGKKYTFRQMHWHSPSEHHIDGQRFPVELHVVHLAEDGSAAVTAILYKYGKPDPLLKKVHKYLVELNASNTQGVSIPIGELDTKHLRRNTHKYYRYTGSFTTPPCTETVVWSILGKVRSISNEQVVTLRAPLASNCKNNARPCQPLHERRIELYSVESGHRHQNNH